MDDDGDDNDDDDDDVEDNFQCPSLSHCIFLVIYFQILLINLPSAIKRHNVLRTYKTTAT
jgi:hypothetical protein